MRGQIQHRTPPISQRLEAGSTPNGIVVLFGRLLFVDLLKNRTQSLRETDDLVCGFARRALRFICGSDSRSTGACRRRERFARLSRKDRGLIDCVVSHTRDVHDAQVLDDG